jgi:hypothetical protein
MENEKVKELVKTVFSLIEKAKSTDDILSIINCQEISEFNHLLVKNAVKTNTFPQINFQFTKDDVKVLENYFENDEFKIKDPLSKLLYSLAWKNGDLGKIKRIYEGVVAELNNSDEKVNQALVFHQFGKHLANPVGQPIIDQHVIRAYAIYVSEGLIDDDIDKIRRIEEITLKHNHFVDGYVNWIKGITEKLDIKDKRDFIYQVDRLLFAVGKTIKLKR